MGRQHVVIGGDDGDIGLRFTLQVVLVIDIAGCESVSEIAAGKRATVRTVSPRILDHLEIGFPARSTSLRDTFGDLDQSRVHRKAAP